MDRGIVGGLIGDLDDDSIIFLGVNNRSWEHFVNGHNLFGVTQFSNSQGLYLCAKKTLFRKTELRILR